MFKILSLVTIILISVLGYKWYIDSNKAELKTNNEVDNNMINSVSINDNKVLEKIEKEAYVSARKKVKMHQEKEVDADSGEESEESEEDIVIMDAMKNMANQNNTVPPEAWTDEEIEVQIKKDKDLLLELEIKEGK